MAKRKLTDSQRTEIAKAHIAGERLVTIAKRYGTTPNHVYMIAKRYVEARPAQMVREAAQRRSVAAIPAMPVDPLSMGSGRRAHSGYTKLM